MTCALCVSSAPKTMPAILYQLLIEQGATFSLPIELTDNSGLSPVNLAGCFCRMQIRQTPDAPVAILSLSSYEGEGIVITPAEGKIVVTVSADVTLNLPAGVFVYDILLEYPSGIADRILQGEVRISADVTR